MKTYYPYQPDKIDEIRSEIFRLETAINEINERTQKLNSDIAALFGEEYSQDAKHGIQTATEHLKRIISDLNSKITIAVQHMTDLYADVPPCGSHMSHNKKSSSSAKKGSSKDYAISTTQEKPNIVKKIEEEFGVPLTLVDALDNKPPKLPPVLPHKKNPTERPKRTPLRYKPPKRIHYRLVSKNAYMDVRNHPPKNLPNEP